MHRETKYDIIIALIHARNFLLENNDVKNAVVNIQYSIEILAEDLGIKKE